ncbi:MAG: hypothetical protein ACRC0C_10450 [Gibbsiella quercinecans]|uniref:hypothetical protein n=1 Tax=Gibbsiella quercinecans TaxID=929813 RepID=UPI003F3783BD
MCGLCGLLSEGPQWSDPLRQQHLPPRQQRLQQLALLNRTLAPWRLTLRDLHGSAWLLASPTGQQAIVTGLEQLWGEVERLIRRPADPLEPGYLAALSDGGADGGNV